MNIRFSFEELEVWKKSIIFASNVIGISENLKSHRKHFCLVEQLEAAATSVSMNIASPVK